MTVKEARELTMTNFKRDVKTVDDYIRSIASKGQYYGGIELNKFLTKPDNIKEYFIKMGFKVNMAVSGGEKVLMISWGEY